MEYLQTLPTNLRPATKGIEYIKRPACGDSGGQSQILELNGSLVGSKAHSLSGLFLCFLLKMKLKIKMLADSQGCFKAEIS